MVFALNFPPLSPEIFAIDIGGFHLALRWYALAYIFGLIIAWRMVAGFMKRPTLWPRNTAPMTPDQPEDLLTWMVIGVVLGGRLGYAIFYQPGAFAEDPLAILRIWEGGMAFHGGFLGVIVAAFLYCRRNALPALQVGDAIAVSAAPGLFLGRIANFINAELWGRQTDLPWGVIFPGDFAQYCPEVAGLCARHPSQLYEAALEGLLLGTAMLWIALRGGGFKRPGTLIGVFLAGYGASRFVVEFFRQPDAQFITANNPLGLAYHVDGVGLTMGQTLSLPMIAAGIAMIIFARRQA